MGWVWTSWPKLAGTYLAPDGPLTKALSAPGGALADQRLWDSPARWSAELPAANGIGDARSLACLYGACVSDVATTTGGSLPHPRSPSSSTVPFQPRTEGPRPGPSRTSTSNGDLGSSVNRGLIGAAGLGGPGGFGHFGMGGSAGGRSRPGARPWAMS